MRTFAGMKGIKGLKERLSTGNFWFYLCYVFIPMLLGVMGGSAIAYIFIKCIVLAR